MPVTEVERRILKNQSEIMWTLNWLIEKTSPDLVGLAGQVDRMRDDLRIVAKDTTALLEKE